MGIFDRKPARGNWLFDSLDLIRNQGYQGLFRGVFNIETGFASISNQFFRECQSCAYLWEFSISCSECGRKSDSYARFRSGQGDGIYAVFSITMPNNLNNAIGALIVMDAGTVQDSLTMVLDQGSPLIFDLDYRDYLNEDFPGLKLNNIVITEKLIIGDASGIADGKLAYINLSLPAGTYSLYVYSHGSFALLIKEELQFTFALDPNYIQVITEGNPQVELKNFSLGFQDDLVLGNLIPQGKNAVSLNLELTNPWRFEILQSQPNPNLDYLTWLVQLWHLSDYKERVELNNVLRTYMLSDGELGELNKVTTMTRGFRMDA